MKAIFLVGLVIAIITGCTPIGYVKNGIQGGYMDIKTTEKNHCKAKFPAKFSTEKKQDFGFIRALELCYGKGYLYFELVSIKSERYTEYTSVGIISSGTPVIEIAGFKEASDKRKLIKEEAEKLKAKYGLNIPIF